MRPCNRRTFLKHAAATTTGLALSSRTQSSSAAEASRRPPNVLFILADQWRFSAFSHGGDPLVKTPCFDRLAEQGARWTRAYSANPVCTPNRAAIVTGRFPHQTGMIHNSLMLPPTERSIADVFRQAGYATHYIGKWHMDGQDKPGFVPKGWRRRGFETFIGFNRGHSYYKSDMFDDDGKPMKPRGYEPTFQTDLAIQFMKQHQDRPFFCYLSWGPPHMPYKPPPQFDRFKPDQLEWRPNVPPDMRANPKTRRELAGYYGLCESLDHEMGRLMAALDDMSLTDDTLIVFTSDHGDMHGSHGKRYKGDPREESLHIPLLMRLPSRIKPSQKPETLVSSIDLMPTILSLCGRKAPKSCTGRDLSSAVLGGSAPDVKSVYAEGRMQLATAWRTIVTPKHKLVIDTALKVTQLSDLENDPYEMTNLAGQRQHAALQRKLLDELRDWSMRTGDTFPKTPTSARKEYGS
ncbi:MAG: sulfatase-like hydrolase/transferase [Phycisphaerae bacterium]|nr:sulfatase-like hydrolase/transferase [Phycisphaerae bacterium]